MTDTPLNEFRFDAEGLIVTSDYREEGTQPWGGAPCYVYIVHVSATEGDWTTKAYGSQHDYSNGDKDHAEEMAWMVLDELLSAYYDPDEFLQLALGEPDEIDLERVRGVIGLIDYAERIGGRLESIEAEIRAYQDGEPVTLA